MTVKKQHDFRPRLIQDKINMSFDNMVHSISSQITFLREFFLNRYIFTYLPLSRKYGMDLKLLPAKTFFLLQGTPSCHVKMTMCFRVEYKDRKLSLPRKIIEHQQHKSHMFTPIFSKERFIRQTPTLYTLIYNVYGCISWYNCNPWILERSVLIICRDM